MKKSLLALAVLGAFAGAAQAQTSVTIYGSFDGGVRHVNKSEAVGKAAPGGSLTTMGSNGTYNSNRLGFKGVEDLGGGMNAHFDLETGFNTGTGNFDNTTSTMFNRTASVGLGGAWGSVDLGRQYSVNFRTIGDYDPFGYKYTSIDPLAGQGATPGASATVAGAVVPSNALTRLNNDIQYTGVFGPVTARVEYALGEVAGATSNGATYAAGLSYNNGPLALGAAYTAGKRDPLLTKTADQSLKNYTLGGAYKFGAARVALGYAKAKQDYAAAGNATVRDAWLGGSYDLTPAASLTAAYFDTKLDAAANTTGKRKLLMVGATYALSKRTNFYAEADTAKLSDAAVPYYALGNGTDERKTGFSVGINHLF